MCRKSQESINKGLELTNEFGKVIGYKVSMWKSQLYFYILVTNIKNVKYILEFILVSKNINQLGVNKGCVRPLHRKSQNVIKRKILKPK